MIRHFIALFVFTVAVSATAVSAKAENLQATPLDSAALAAATGGNEASVNSTISSNSIGNVGYTGGIANVTASGNSGLTTLIENTGNQVSISTATVVNVNFH